MIDTRNTLQDAQRVLLRQQMLKRGSRQRSESALDPFFWFIEKSDPDTAFPLLQ